MLQVADLSATLGSFKMRDVSFSIADGEYFVLLGPSGAGKSVLVETIAGLVKADTGSVVLAGKDITQERIQNRGVGLIFQKPELFPHLTVRDNIAYGLSHRGLSREKRKSRIAEVASATGVKHLLDRDPVTLSGGEAQRVALARALAPEPECLLLDEPLASLDAQARLEMRRLLRGLNRGGMTMLHVTHDFEEAISLGQQIGIIDGGKVIQSGPTEKVLSDPNSNFVARFIGFRNVWSGTLETVREDDYDIVFFKSGGVKFSLHMVQDEADLRGEVEGFLFLRSEDIILSGEKPETSARNSFYGRITDIAPTSYGVEVTVDVGQEVVVEVTSLITESSVRQLGLQCGKEIWVSFKATAGKFCAT